VTARCLGKTYHLKNILHRQIAWLHVADHNTVQDATAMTLYGVSSALSSHGHPPPQMLCMLVAADTRRQAWLAHAGAVPMLHRLTLGQAAHRQAESQTAPCDPAANDDTLQDAVRGSPIKVCNIRASDVGKMAMNLRTASLHNFGMV
jgi:hypothetical protein